MLGHLEMDIASCSQAYLELSKNVFKVRHSHNPFARLLDLVRVKGKFSSTKLGNAIKAIVNRKYGHDDAIFRHENPRCRE